MINSIGQPQSSAIEAKKLREGGKSVESKAVSSNSAATSSVSASPATRMAAQGAPVDTDRIATIKAAIASGNYPVNAQAIAEKMVALDLRPVA